MTETTMTDEQRQQGLKESYTEANKRLRTEYAGRFNALRKEEAAKRGIAWDPKPTAEQKAADQIEALLGEFPALREQYATVEPEPEDEPEPEVD